VNLLPAGASLPSEAPFGRWNELRKGVKDLGYDLRLLGGNRPRPIEALTKRLSELRQKLGDDPDLAMLLAARADNPSAGIRGLGDARKSNRLPSPRLQRAALQLAAKALVRKPGAFADFVAGRWESWHSHRKTNEHLPW
jgi:hypothetical protein